MKNINELIDSSKETLSLLKDWLESSENNVSIVPTTVTYGKNTLYHLQVTTTSFLGTIAYYTGGILINNGWLRILGGGNEEIERNLLSWNKFNEIENSFERYSDGLLIADDVIGGFFAINNNPQRGKIGNVFYFAPEILEWEDLEIQYSQFIEWCITGDIYTFYKQFLWNGWKSEVEKVKISEGISIIPFLWAEGDEIINRSRKIIPIDEIWDVSMEFSKKLSKKR